jgi:hypothetical protein
MLRDFIALAGDSAAHLWDWAGAYWHAFKPVALFQQCVGPGAHYYARIFGPDCCVVVPNGWEYTPYPPAKTVPRTHSHWWEMPWFQDWLRLAQRA